MRICEQEMFYCHWKQYILYQKDSRVAVFLRSRQDWESLNVAFLEGFSWEYSILFLELESWTEDTEKMLLDWKPDFLAGVGDVTILLEILQLREYLGDREKDFRDMSLYYFTEDGRWRSFLHRQVWLRDDSLKTIYWGIPHRIAKDLLVKEEKELRDPFWEAVQEWRKLFMEAVGEQHDQRRIWEELAEPLYLKYGIPRELGDYLALYYLYDILEPAKKKNLEQRFEISIRSSMREKKKKGDFCQDDREYIIARWRGHWNWYMEKLAMKYRRPQLLAIKIPAVDVPLLVEAAMEGIEQLSGWQLSIRQVKEFYQSLCVLFTAET